ncbi:MAG TPA: SDR family oxidoreductase [Solirubrobacteraceae bacterium]|jgi:NAD(P)-dependent dehydrogenase (short-subunit alcohol dehydrogenase family)
MEVAGKVVVVTGGAGGIGRALARRMAAEGAAGVVVADLDGAGAERVAGEVEAAGGRAVGVGGDVTTDENVRALLERAERDYGPVDVFCANAGVAVGGDPHTTPQAEWDLAFDVNIRAHVVAARLLLPGWLERGSGCFLSTASAAGLVTQIGSAPYAVTKHAAVAFAEWLSITYGERGVHVACLCPMGVNTEMLHAGGDENVASATVTAAGAVLEPEDVADAVIEGLRAERFLILPHPEVLTFFQRKASDYDRWLAGMRRLQRTVTPPAPAG